MVERNQQKLNNGITRIVQKARQNLAVPERKFVLKMMTGMSAPPHFSLATAVTFKKQNFAEFKELLNKALQIDPEAFPENRLVNVLNQHKALWLLEYAEDIFRKAEENTTDIEEE